MKLDRTEGSAIELCRRRSRLRRVVGALLAGSGLEIRELNRELVISNPRQPDKGRVYVTYTTGEVSWRQTTWDYWGYLDGYGRAPWADPDTEPGVGIGQIVGTLGGRVGTGGRT